MDIIRKKTWESFRDWLSGYFQESAERRQQLVFRGHRDAGWPLLTTLDRIHQFGDDDKRKRFNEELIEAFRAELLHVDSEGAAELRGTAMELLARHQGLPSPLMDWTESPYIAAFFAFANCTDDDRQKTAIWMMDRVKMEPAVDLAVVDDSSLLRFNQRAVRQRGIFIRVGKSISLDESIGDALTKIVIPATEYRRALAELDAMTINATYLFADMEAAARTAHFRAASRRNG